MHLSGVIIKDATGGILLLHRATKKRTQWEIPGGKIEVGENPAEAAAREAYEELDAKIEIVRELGEQSFSEDGHEFLYTWFLGVPASGNEPSIGEPDKYDDLRYWSPESLAATTESISPNTRNFVQQLRIGAIQI